MPGHDLDAGQRVLDFVRDGRGHLAERRQPVAQPLALLELLDPRQVLEEQRRARDLARGVAHLRQRVADDPAGALSRISARLGRWDRSNAPGTIRVTSGGRAARP